MEHIRLFNSVNEKDDYIDADTFKYDIVGLVKSVKEVVYNPPEEIIHSYTISGITYDNSVPFDSTANTVSWDYTLDKTTRSGKHINTSGTDSQTIEYPINTDSTDKDISGEITKYGVNIPYNFTQETGVDKYFSFTALEDGTFTFSGNSSNTSIQYSVDYGNTWVTLASNVPSPTITSGNKIIWKGELTTTSSGIGTFISTGKFNVSGNIMSLLYGDDFVNKTSLSGKDYVFKNLFYKNENLISAESLILPATELSSGCYWSMFDGCKSLTTAPELPATTLAEYCYREMFDSCESLIESPELPATTLAVGCYDGMFFKCTSLTTAPELPATTLANNCYDGMFRGCSSLTVLPNLPGTPTAEHCYDGMFKGCSSLTVIPSNYLSANTVGQYAYAYMFEGCTSLTTAPELPATSINRHSYSCMFRFCSSLINAPSILPAMTMYEQCYSSMFWECTNLTTAPILPATTIKSSCYKQMFYGCSSLNYIKAMFTTTPTSGGDTSSWVTGVSPTGTFVKNSSATWDIRGVYGIPEGWTVETASS